MKKLLGVTLLSFFSAISHADIPVEEQDGHLFWSGKCATNYKFSYFDSTHIRRACVVSTDTVPIEKLVTLSKDYDCFGQVRVDSGVIREDVLYPNKVSKVYGCHGGREEFFF